jgi:hypothetical protein
MATRKAALLTLLVLLAMAALSSGEGVSAGGSSGAVAAGGAHSCAVTSTGGAKCWGANESGQLGDGTTTGRDRAVDVAGLSSGVDSVAGGLSFACALTTGGAAKCWGSNASGQLGDGSATDRSQPVAVSGLGSGVAAISAGWAHTCALLAGGAVKCWGDNTYGQLGDGTTTGSATPVDVTGLSEGATAIATGGYFTCARTTAGGVECWGDNTFGQVGDGTEEDRSSPTQVTGLTSGVAGIGAGGGGHACAIMSAGGAKCWGNNEFGQLGENRACPTPCTAPVDVQGLDEHVTAIAGGYLFSCALTSTGGVKCWGNNVFGQLGDNFTCGDLCGAPVNVAGLTSGATALTTGSRHACARTASGARCWGDNFHGELGDAGACGTRCGTAVDVRGLSPVTPGDVNCDRTTNSIDAALILQLGAGLVHSLACPEAADVNHDGRMNSIDAALILQYSAGLLHTLP